jgi:phenylpyruvate tautomerase PptA (4-oxalocrotonate tautomerase family)
LVNREEAAMPMFDLTCPQGAIEAEDREEVMQRLTSALVRHEGAPEGSSRAQGMAWGFVHEMPEGAVTIAGRRPVRPIYRLEVTVPAGTLLGGPGPVGTASRRNLVREASEIILAGEGTTYSPAEALRVYCIVREVPDGHWGGFGTTLRMDDIVAVADPSAGDTELAAQIRPHADELLASQLVGGGRHG